ncbi:hypothetical protein HT031_005600 [Scenedesmus sp. PABB004]|nr:hypothetical protein HT031_005600 [Scenedesmus sp. PABB004]
MSSLLRVMPQSAVTLAVYEAALSALAPRRPAPPPRATAADEARGQGGGRRGACLSDSVEPLVIAADSQAEQRIARRARGSAAAARGLAGSAALVRARLRPHPLLAGVRGLPGRLAVRLWVGGAPRGRAGAAELMDDATSGPAPPGTRRVRRPGALAGAASAPRARSDGGGGGGGGVAGAGDDDDGSQPAPAASCGSSGDAGSDDRRPRKRAAPSSSDCGSGGGAKRAAPSSSDCSGGIDAPAASGGNAGAAGAEAGQPAGAAAQQQPVAQQPAQQQAAQQQPPQLAAADGGPVPWAELPEKMARARAGAAQLAHEQLMALLAPPQPPPPELLQPRHGSFKCGALRQRAAFLQRRRAAAAAAAAEAAPPAEAVVEPRTWPWQRAAHQQELAAAAPPSPPAEPGSPAAAAQHSWGSASPSRLSEPPAHHDAAGYWAAQHVVPATPLTTPCPALNAAAAPTGGQRPEQETPLAGLCWQRPEGSAAAAAGSGGRELPAGPEPADEQPEPARSMPVAAEQAGREGCRQRSGGSTPVAAAPGGDAEARASPRASQGPRALPDDAWASLPSRLVLSPNEAEFMALVEEEHAARLHSWVEPLVRSAAAGDADAVAQLALVGQLAFDPRPLDADALAVALSRGADGQRCVAALVCAAWGSPHAEDAARLARAAWEAGALPEGAWELLRVGVGAEQFRYRGCAAVGDYLLLLLLDCVAATSAAAPHLLEPPPGGSLEREGRRALAALTSARREAVERVAAAHLGGLPFLSHPASEEQEATLQALLVLALAAPDDAEPRTWPWQRAAHQQELAAAAPPSPPSPPAEPGSPAAAAQHSWGSASPSRLSEPPAHHDAAGYWAAQHVVPATPLTTPCPALNAAAAPTGGQRPEQETPLAGLCWQRPEGSAAAAAGSGGRELPAGPEPADEQPEPARSMPVAAEQAGREGCRQRSGGSTPVAAAPGGDAEARASPRASQGPRALPDDAWASLPSRLVLSPNEAEFMALVEEEHAARLHSWVEPLVRSAAAGDADAVAQLALVGQLAFDPRPLDADALAVALSRGADGQRCVAALVCAAWGSPHAEDAARLARAAWEAGALPEGAWELLRVGVGAEQFRYRGCAAVGDYLLLLLLDCVAATSAAAPHLLEPPPGGSLEREGRRALAALTSARREAVERVAAAHLGGLPFLSHPASEEQEATLQALLVLALAAPDDAEPRTWPWQRAAHQQELAAAAPPSPPSPPAEPGSPAAAAQHSWGSASPSRLSEPPAHHDAAGYWAAQHVVPATPLTTPCPALNAAAAPTGGQRPEQETPLAGLCWQRPEGSAAAAAGSGGRELPAGPEPADEQPEPARSMPVAAEQAGREGCRQRSGGSTPVAAAPGGDAEARASPRASQGPRALPDDAWASLPSRLVLSPNEAEFMALVEEEHAARLHSWVEPLVRSAAAGDADAVAQLALVGQLAFDPRPLDADALAVALSRGADGQRCVAALVCAAWGSPHAEDAARLARAAWEAGALPEGAWELLRVGVGAEQFRYRGCAAVGDYLLLLLLDCVAATSAAAPHLLEPPPGGSLEREGRRALAALTSARREAVERVAAAHLGGLPFLSHPASEEQEATLQALLVLALAAPDEAEPRTWPWQRAVGQQELAAAAVGAAAEQLQQQQQQQRQQDDEQQGPATASPAGEKKRRRHKRRRTQAGATEDAASTSAAGRPAVLLARADQQGNAVLAHRGTVAVQPGETPPCAAASPPGPPAAAAVAAPHGAVDYRALAAAYVAAKRARREAAEQQPRKRRPPQREVTGADQQPRPKPLRRPATQKVGRERIDCF